MLNYIAIIPARKNSQRIKNKNTIKIKNKTLICYTIDAAKKVKKINKIIVSTDDRKIIKLSIKKNISFFLRPKNISNSKTSMEKTIVFTLINIFGNKFYNKVKNVVLLQPTSPLRTHIDINKAIHIFEKKKYDSLFSAYKEKKFIWRYNKKLFSISYNYKFRENTQNMKNLIFENGAIYIFDAKKFATFKNRLFNKIGVYFMKKNKSLDLDDKEDLRILKKII
jgi:CMP-N,N'-diacetyllegionaminic acid synthase